MGRKGKKIEEQFKWYVQPNFLFDSSVEFHIEGRYNWFIKEIDMKAYI